MFVLAKIAGFVASSGFLIGFPLLLALLWFRRRPGLARSLLALDLLALVALAMLPIGSLLLVPLEERFLPPATLPADVAGIIVLGGSFDLDVSTARGSPALNGAAERITAAVALARRLPRAPFYFSGGDNRLRPGVGREADFAKAIFLDLGVAPERLILEPDARTTYENAARLAKLLHPAPGQQWLLVTSAAHMPRAMGAFRRAGWSPTAYPVDFRSDGEFALREPHLLPELANLDAALHEWVGLVGYRLLGYTDELVPSP